MGEIYVGDIVRLSEEYGGLLGTLTRVGDDEDGSGPYAVVQLSGASKITVPPGVLSYAGPPIPPEPEVGVMVLIADTPYCRDDKGWAEMGKADGGTGTISLDSVIAAFFPPASGNTWGRILRRHGHAKPRRLIAVDLDSGT